MTKILHSQLGNPKCNSGFTLLEILISVVILSIGLLGLAGLQATGLQNNLTAYQRSQATILSYDIADRMRTNIPAITAYKTNNSFPNSKVASCLTTTGCSANNMAKNDLFEWGSTLKSTLPLGQAKIEASGDIYTITISWDSNKDGQVNTDDSNFIMSFEP